MVKFEYTFCDVDIFKGGVTGGFNVNFGNEDTWDDIEIATINKHRKQKDKKYVPITEEWLNKVCDFISKQRQLKSLSSWIFKFAPQTTEHQIIVETDSWYREISVYNFGELGRHHHPEYAEDEKILLEFFKKIQEFLLEVGVVLTFNKVRVI